MLSKMGIQGEVVPMKSINYGIECVHRLIPRLRINSDTCAKLVKNIELYHKRFDEKNNVYLDTPVHDEASHCADSLRMLAVMERDRINATIAKQTFIPPSKQYDPFNH